MHMALFACTAFGYYGTRWANKRFFTPRFPPMSMKAKVIDDEPEEVEEDEEEWGNDDQAPAPYGPPCEPESEPIVTADLADGAASEAAACDIVALTDLDAASEAGEDNADIEVASVVACDLLCEVSDAASVVTASATCALQPQVSGRVAKMLARKAARKERRRHLAEELGADSVEGPADGRVLDPVVAKECPLADADDLSPRSTVAEDRCPSEEDRSPTDAEERSAAEAEPEEEVASDDEAAPLVEEANAGLPEIARSSRRAEAVVERLLGELLPSGTRGLCPTRCRDVVGETGDEAPLIDEAVEEATDSSSSTAAESPQFMPIMGPGGQQLYTDGQEIFVMACVAMDGDDPNKPPQFIALAEPGSDWPTASFGWGGSRVGDAQRAGRRSRKPPCRSDDDLWSMSWEFA